MPELPEVETVKRSLASKLIGLTIKKAIVRMPKLLKLNSLEEFTKNIQDKDILALERRGKYLLFELSSNFLLIIHLGMTGQLVYQKEKALAEKHTHVIFKLDNQGELHYTDIRRFGRIILTTMENKNQISGLKDLGPEPLGSDFTKEYLKNALGKKKSCLKALLLNQSLVAGLGNIYVDEALHQANLHPQKLGNNLSPEEVNKLYCAIKKVLKQGIENKGTSIKDYVDGEGKAGSNQENLWVYGRKGNSCKKCGLPIEKIKVAGRSSFFCPKCQALDQNHGEK